VEGRRFYTGDFPAASHLTFGATLSEGTSAIDIVLANIDAIDPGPPPVDRGLGDMAVLGLQSGNSAVNFSCHQNLAPEGTEIHYLP
jgi:hypothetical protein